MFSWDRIAFDFLFDLTEKFSFFNWLLVFLAEGLPFLLIIGFIIYSFSIRKFSNRFYFLAIALLSIILSKGILTEVIRLIVMSLRPFAVLDIEPLIAGPLSFSMPSGHMASLAPLSFVIYDRNKKLGIWYAGLTIIVGIGRVMAGVHWLSDIAVGFIVGALSFYIVKQILPRPNQTA